MELYFDANATGPPSEEAMEAWLMVSRKHWHNPSSLYPEALEAKQMLESLREELGDLSFAST
jgi:cysteine sulfinate desulfinase/cysteine desulfurase-like protein